MKRWILALVVWVVAWPAKAQIEVEAAPSEAVELIYVMMSLTDVPSFNPPNVLPEYKTFVDQWFAEHKNHSAIRFITRKLFKENLDMVAPASIGVNSEIIDGRFVYPGNYYGWRDNLYPRFVSAFNDVIIPRLNLGWLDRFVPVEGTPGYGLTICLLSGSYNFGVARNGVPTPVIGVANPGLILNPTFRTFETYLPVTVHEYMHSFCNPLVDKYYTELEKSGEIIFPRISEQMNRANYGNWRIVLYEAFVRASEVVYMRSDDLLNQSVDDHIEKNKESGFYWIGELADLLQEYEASRDRYPSLDSFMPRIVEFYEQLSKQSR